MADIKGLPLSEVGDVVVAEMAEQNGGPVAITLTVLDIATGTFVTTTNMDAQAHTDFMIFLGQQHAAGEVSTSGEVH